MIERTLNSTPKAATHWSIRSMAVASGLSHTTIRRIWGAFGLQPHRSETFKRSTDPLFVDKVQDIVGLYMSPPNRAVVLGVDDKSQIQAQDREQPVLPMAPGVPERRTHTYIRNSRTSLFAALEADITAFIKAHNENPKPYKWVKSADETLASVRRFCQKTISRTSVSGD